MKKTVALLLALAMCLSLCACGNRNAVSGTWISIWDESEKLILNKDGSGDIFGYECKWKQKDSTVTISYTGGWGVIGGLLGNGKPEYNLVNQNGISVLKKGANTENFLIADDLIREEGYAENKEALRNAQVEQAIEIEWSDFIRELYYENSARAKAKYEGKPIVTTLIVYEIADNLIKGSDMVTDRTPGYPATVFLPATEIMKLNVGMKITVCGYFGADTFNTNSNIYSPIEPAFLVSDEYTTTKNSNVGEEGQSQNRIIQEIVGEFWYANGGSDTKLDILVFGEDHAEVASAWFDGNGRQGEVIDSCAYVVDGENIILKLSDGTERAIPFSFDGNDVILDNGKYISQKEINQSIQGCWKLRDSGTVLGEYYEREYNISIEDGYLTYEQASLGRDLPVGEYYYSGPYSGHYELDLGAFKTDIPNFDFGWGFNIIDGKPIVLHFGKVCTPTDGLPGQNGYSFS